MNNRIARILRDEALKVALEVKRPQLARQIYRRLKREYAKGKVQISCEKS